MGEIINHIIKLANANAELQGIIIKNYPEHIANDWVGGEAWSSSDAQSRITNLMAKLMSTKISVEISPTVLTGNSTFFDN